MEDMKIEELSLIIKKEQVAQAAQLPVQLPAIQNPVELLYHYAEQAKAATNLQLAKGSFSVASSTTLTAANHSLGAPPKRGLGGSLPQPNNPSSGAPDPSIPSGDDETNYQGTGYLDKLAQFISYLENNPNDPQGLQNFMQFVANLAAAGDMTPDVVNMLNEASTNTLLQVAIQQGMETSFFAGYNGVNGQTGASNYLNDLIKALGGYPQGDPFIQTMLGQANFMLSGLSEFTSLHTIPAGQPGAGDLIWTYNGITYDWSNPTKYGDDQNMISQIIDNQGLGISGDPNPYYNQLNLNAYLRDYRLTALEELLKQFAGHPEIALCLWMMTAYDNQFQSEQGGLAASTNLLTTLTNSYATPLLLLAQKIGHLDGDDLSQFEALFFNANNIIGMENQTSTIASDWTNNVFNMIGGITGLTITADIPADVASKVTLLQVLTGQTVTWSDSGGEHSYTFGALDALNALNGFYIQPPSGGTAPSTSPGYQTILDALQQGGSLITGTSKTLATQLSTVSNTDNAIIKFGHSVVDPTGGGLVQMENKVIDNQVSH